MRSTMSAIRSLGFALTLACSTASADVVAVVSAKSPITTLTKIQVADLFLGRSIRFPGGSPAVAIDQREGAAARDEFYATFTNKSAVQMRAYWSKIIFTGRGLPPQAVSDDAEIKKLLTENPQAIAYLERSAVDGTVRVVAQP
jgi:hypothetical protein